MMSRIHLKYALAALLFGICTGALAQNVNPDDNIAVDPHVRMGRLENGLRYYIRHNEKPENRVEMRLAVNAGSMQETDFQKGLAHFTEHMCFNGTKNFPKNELINYLQKTGVKFGADINAYTGFDETVYMLQLPVDDKDLVNKGFQVLEDWAHHVTFDDKEIDKERGVIVEEWRMGLGADDRMRKEYFPVIFRGSRYAERLPIGDINIVQTFKYDTIRQFYRDWYRPSLQSIVIVGDIDVDSVEMKIREQFASMQDPAQAKPRINYEIPGNTEPLIAIASDKEAVSTNVMIFYKHPRAVMKTVAQYRQYIINELFTGMLNERLQEYNEKPDAPFIYAYNYYGGFLARNADAYVIMGMIKENMIDPGFRTLLTETERVKRYGFLTTEMERMKEDMLTRYDKAAREFNKTESARFAGEYVSNFLTEEPMPGAKNELRYVKSLLPGITLEEINAMAAKWITENNMVVVVTAPEKESIQMPSEQNLLDIIQQVRVSNIEAYVDKFKDEPLLDAALSGSAVAENKKNEEFDYQEVVLKNGIKIIIKNTDFKNDEILFSATSPGGTSLYPIEDHISAYFASQIINESGLGKFDNTELQKRLKGKSVEINPYIDDLMEGFTGKTTPRDIETLLQLTYLYFAGVRYDSLAFDASLSRTRNQLKFISNNPVYAFIDTLLKAASNNDPRMIILPREKQLDQINLKTIHRVYNDRFANAGDFTFYLVGNISMDTVLPLLEKYLGSLPVTGRKETWKDVTAGFPGGATEVKINKGSDPKSMVGIVLQQPIEWSDSTRLYLRMLKEIISIKLIEVIREEMSGVYSPQVQLSAEKYPTPEYTLMIMFGCSPKNTEKLTKAVFKIMDNLRKNGPAEEDVSKAKELLLRERETDLKLNKWWLNKLENRYFQNDEIGNIGEFAGKVNNVTGANLQRAAQTYLVKDHYVRTVLFPEKKKK